MNHRPTFIAAVVMVLAVMATAQVVAADDAAGTPAQVSTAASQSARI